MVGEECHPRLDDQVSLVEGDQGHEVGGIDQVGRCGREDPYRSVRPELRNDENELGALTSKHRTPPRAEAQEAVVPSRRDGRNPVVHASFDGVCGYEFRQRRS